MKLQKNTPFTVCFNINGETFLVASVYSGTSITVGDTKLYVFNKASDMSKEYFRTAKQVQDDVGINDKNARTSETLDTSKL